MVLGIFFVVGIDVGINSTSGQFLMERMNMDVEPAKQGRSLYFFGKMAGTFLGALLLARLSPKKFLMGSSIATVLAILIFIYSSTPFTAISFMFLIGMTSSNIFPLIFSITVKRYQERANEISGLMVMAISGGALIPPVAGWISDVFNVTVAMFIFLICSVYLLFMSIYALKTK